MVTAETKTEYIRLDYHGEGQKVIVTPQNQDRFMLSVREAAIACQMADDSNSFIQQFKELLENLASWLKRHGSKVERAFVTIRDAGFVFLVVQRNKSYNREFEDLLTELDMSIAQDQNLNLIRLNVLALPKSSKESYESFLVPEHTWTYRHAK